MIESLSQIGVVMPVYRETESLEKLLSQFMKVSESVRHVVVVDDSEFGESSKVASKFVEILGSRNVKVKIISNFCKKGRGSAVRQGFQYLLDNTEIDFFVEIDGDGSHNLHEIDSLVTNVAPGKYAIASRYLAGSKIHGWSLRRKIMSKAVNIVIRRILDLKLSDCTNGYRAYSRESVEFLLGHQPVARDFLYLSEQAWLLKAYGVASAEIPSIFTNRVFGKSSVNTRVLTQAVFSLIRLRRLKTRQHS
jgi:dolichol-phosphate mannosyltransferase